MTDTTTIDDGAPNDTITVIDGPPQNGFQTTRVVINGGNLPVDVTNTPALVIDALNNNDNVLLDNPHPATGLQSLTIQNLGGSGSITGTNPQSSSPDVAVASLNLTAAGAIGTGTRALQTQASTLSAVFATGGTGSLNIANGVAAPVTLTVTDLSGTGSGRSASTITLSNNGTINDTGTGITATGGITITTTGATADLNTGSGGGIASNGSSINLTVGGDLNLGDSAGTGNILADTGVLASAGGNITLNANAAIINGSGNITLTAGGNLTMLAAPGNQSNAPAITDQTGGTIQLSAGKGHTLTVDSSGLTAISASPGGASIVLTADAMVINQAINATSSGSVILQTATLGQISLGAANAPGVLGLTQAELNRITASVVEVSGFSNITIASPITTLTNSSTLELANIGNISQATFGSLTMSNLLLLSTGLVTLNNPNNNIGTIAGHANNGLTLVNGTHTLTVGSVSGFTGIATSNSAISFTADNIVINQPINAFTGIVTLAPFTTTLSVTLGTASVPGSSFGLTDAELGDITASVLRVDDFGVGANSLAISGAVTRHAGYNTLSLTTPGGISQSAALAVASLALDSGSGIALTNSSNSVDNLAFTNFSNAVSFTNTGANGLTIAAVDGITSSSNIGGGTTISTGGNLTLAAGLSSIGGGTVLTSTNGQILDGGNGAIVDVTTPTLTLSASTGIGTSTAPLETQVATLNGAATSTGGIFISNGTAGNATPATLAIGSSGVKVTGASGDISITNNGTINSLDSSDVVTGPGNITVKALGANGDVNVGNSTTIPIFGGGLVDVEAGRDVNLGNSVGVGAVFSSAGSVKIVAGRNLTMNANGAVAVLSGTGGITATAGGNITMTTATGTQSAPFFLTEGGPIALTTGAGGTLTVASKATNAITSSNGNITLSADFMNINQGVNAGTGNVLIQPVTAGQQISLGTATGDLNLTSVELKQVTAQTLTIGNASAGQVTVAGTIGPGGVGAINLTNGGSGFTSAPNVTITGGGGIGATAVATEQGGVVTGVQVTAQGQGFTSTPTISFNGGGGSGAAGAAVLTGPLGVSNLTINTGSNFTGTGATLNVGTGTLTIHFGQNGLGDTETLALATITAGAINVIGGAGNDTFVVGSGNETINGGGGGDTAFFAGTEAQYNINTAANGAVRVTDTVSGRNGTNTLIGISSLAFSDQTIQVAPVQPSGPMNIVGFGNFDGTGATDLAWERGSDNAVFLEFLNGNNEVGAGFIANNPFPAAGFRVISNGDFNGNGTTDLVYQRPSDNLTEIQFLNGINPAGGGEIANNAFVGTDFQIVAHGEFNGDGNTDLVWQRPTDNLTEIQFLNGIQVVGGGTIANNAFVGTNFQIVADGDFNGDGKTDLVWWQAASGITEIQFLNGTQGVGGGAIANNPFGTDFQIVGAGDFNGDGKADLVWQRPSDGLTEIQFLNGTTGVGGGAIANNPFQSPDLQVVGVGDFNHDGKEDIAYRSISTGTTDILLLNGLTLIGSGATPDGFLPSPNTTNPLIHGPAIM